MFSPKLSSFKIEASKIDVFGSNFWNTFAFLPVVFVKTTAWEETLASFFDWKVVVKVKLIYRFVFRATLMDVLRTNAAATRDRKHAVTTSNANNMEIFIFHATNVGIWLGWIFKKFQLWTKIVFEQVWISSFDPFALKFFLLRLLLRKIVFLC